MQHNSCASTTTTYCNADGTAFLDAAVNLDESAASSSTGAIVKQERADASALVSHSSMRYWRQRAPLGDMLASTATPSSVGWWSELVDDARLTARHVYTAVALRTVAFTLYERSRSAARADGVDDERRVQSIIDTCRRLGQTSAADAVRRRADEHRATIDALQRDIVDALVEAFWVVTSALIHQAIASHETEGAAAASSIGASADQRLRIVVDQYSVTSPRYAPLYADNDNSTGGNSDDHRHCGDDDAADRHHRHAPCAAAATHAVASRVLSRAVDVIDRYDRVWRTSLERIAGDLRSVGASTRCARYRIVEARVMPCTIAPSSSAPAYRLHIAIESCAAGDPLLKLEF